MDRARRRGLKLMTVGPDGGTIGLIWAVLYPVIVVSFGWVFVQAVRGKIPRAVAVPFAINLVAMFVLLALEYGNPKTLGGLPDWGAKVWAAWFQAVAPRTAGR